MIPASFAHGGKPRWLSCLFSLLFGLIAAEAQAVSGKVVDAQGDPLPGVLVEHAESGRRTMTLDGGAFSLPGLQPPVALRLFLDGYGERVVKVSSRGELPLSLELRPQAIEGGEISVVGAAPVRPLVPVSLASTTLHPEELAGAPAALTDLVVRSPAVSENGQGGLFQVVSVRGVSRQRLRTMVAGVPIFSDRRAGASVSFVDPLLIGAVDVVRGPVSSGYGSGALGGAVQTSLRSFEGVSIQGGYDSYGDGSHGAFGWGDEDGTWSAGLAHRRRSAGEDARGDRLNDGFRQTSAFVERRWDSAELTVFGSLGEDIGKPNTRFPELVTVYPREEHLLVRFATDLGDDWRLETYLHPNELETRDENSDGSRAFVDNEAFDLGAGLRRRWGRFRLGLDYQGRRGVGAREVQVASGGGRETFETLEDGEQDEIGLLAATSWAWGKARLEAGGRWIWFRQANGSELAAGLEGSSSITDTSASFFTGLVLPVGDSFEVLANAGSGLRFPSLGERFFTGTTGRGQAVANPDLEPEEALTFDAGLRWFGRRHAVSLFSFYNRIDGFIDRVEIAPDVLTFRNLVSGTLRGVELEALLQPTPSFQLTFGGHWIRGRDSEGAPLEDVPAHRLQAAGELSRGPWTGALSWQFREAIDRPAAGEKETPSAHLVDLTLSRDLGNGLSLDLSASNLLDEEYFPSADNRASLAPGRRFGAAFRWAFR